MEEAPNSPKKDSHKRRSAIFQRKSILLLANDNVTENDTILKTDDVCLPLTDNENPQVGAEAEPFDLQAYINNLKREKKDWHSMLHKRKDQVQQLTKKRMTIEKTGQEVDLNLLSEFERDFIKAKPNYESIAENFKTLGDLAVKIVVLNQHCNKLFDNLYCKIEKKIKDDTTRIISTID